MFLSIPRFSCVLAGYERGTMASNGLKDQLFRDYLGY